MTSSILTSFVSAVSERLVVAARPARVGRAVGAASFAAVLAVATVGCSKAEPKAAAATPTPAANPAKKAATGAPAAKTTKKPASTPAPTATVAGTTTDDVESALDTAETCTPEEEGLGACFEEFVVFCSAGHLYALDCDAAFGGVCGEVDGAIGCVEGDDGEADGDDGADDDGADDDDV